MLKRTRGRETALVSRQQSAASPARTNATRPEDAALAHRKAAAEAKRFVDAFGPQGGVWLAEGKSFEEATRLSQLTNAVGPGLAKFAAGIKLPARKNVAKL
jgi:hypothetical protein